ncbi:MAG: pyridoxal phosphate-dependent aminotransferase [Acidobacteria bacterium]|nr:pyridoxal phosphate-dependent aminotransferase [Acidobacteriota bacterium]
MGSFLDSVPTSGIIRIRDLMYAVERPFRLDQGDVSFDAPDTFKAAIKAAVDANHSHYLQTAGLPRLRQLLADKLRRRNRIPVDDPDELLITNGGVHALYLASQALVEPGDEVLMPDPVWPQMLTALAASGARPVRVPLHESRGWRFDLDEVAAHITPRTKGIYVNSPGNPAGGVFTREDLARLAGLVREHNLWVIADEAYEDVVFDGHEHVSIASFEGLHDRTASMFTFSKTYAATGLRLGYLALRNPVWRARATKLLALTATNVSSIVQYGAIGVLEGDQHIVELYRAELQARRDLFYAGVGEAAGHVFSGAPPDGSFYAFMKIDPSWTPPPEATSPSQSWAMMEYLVGKGRIGCVPGVDFGPTGENHLRFCFARDRAELSGALDAMRALFR